VFFEKGEQLLAEHIVLHPMSRKSGEMMPFHQRFLSSEVQSRIGEQFVKNPINGGMAFADAQCLLQFVHDVEQFLMLLVEKSDVYFVKFVQRKTQCASDIVLPLGQNIPLRRWGKGT
jgi:hypothetical protein